MPLDTRNKNIYGLGVGILTIFKLFVHFLFEGGHDHTGVQEEEETVQKQ